MGYDAHLNLHKMEENYYTTIHDCKLIDLRKISDPRGNLTVIEENGDVPFEIKRVYYLYDVPGGESRGAHAHKELYQLIVAASGSFTVTLDDGHEKVSYNLKRPYYGLLLVPGIWRDLDDYTPEAINILYRIIKTYI